VVPRTAILLLLVSAALAQAPAPRAYEALRERDWDAAIALFREAITAAPASAGLRKDLGYALLQTGDTEAARDQFAEAIRLDPSDERIALEFAFLCYETKRQAEARRAFDRLRQTGSPETRATAERAFENIDRPLAEGIARWSAVVARSPENFSARVELARLLDQRGELAPAADEYLAAWRLRPDERDLLVDAARLLLGAGRAAEARTALLAASRSSRARVAESARELLEPRYPYVPEFRAALALDPGNTELRRELAYLLLEMGQKAEAEREFRTVADQAPADLLAAAQLGFLLLERNDRPGALASFDRVLKSDDDELIAKVRAALRLPAELRRRRRAAADPSPDGGISAKEMGERSFKAGYLNDALRYFQAAHEADPSDFAVMLRLGWTYNLLRQDEQAVRWFELARRSPDPDIAADASRAYRGLRPEFASWRLTAWAFPFYSSRWHDLFSYGQVKADLRLGDLPFRPYLSLRFIGDTRGTTGEALPQYLSESSLLVALGVATRYWHGAMAWAEAGSAIRYTGANTRGRAVSDYRGGVAFARGKGHLLGDEAAGWFAETHLDGVFVSRFGNDFLVYSQNQTGYTLPAAAGLRAQAYWNGNLTFDSGRQEWANFFELGPGLRLRWDALTPSLVFSVNLLRGAYLRPVQSPRQPVFFDLRAGFSYALTR
jgi:Flp pilus assembly protein TadD